MKKTREKQVQKSPQTRLMRWTGFGLLGLGALFLIVGLVEMGGLAARHIHPFTLPGTTTLTLKNPGVYLAVHRATSTTTPPWEVLSQLEVGLVSLPSGQPLDVGPVPAGPPMTLGGRPGVLLFRVEIPAPGTYSLSGRYRQGAEEPLWTVVLMPEEVQAVRSELITGLVLWVLLSGLGLTLLWKSFSAAKKPPINEARRTL